MRIWTESTVGCYWSYESFAISTVTEYPNGERGDSYYKLVTNFREIGRFDTLEEAKQAAEKEAT